ncbi:MAG: HlyD family efflux transporter periplasmic adaptor subunit [Filomicrobium sp.]
MQFSFRLFAVLAVIAAGAAYVIANSDDTHPVPDGIAYGNGRLEAVEVDIETKIPGRVEKVMVREGDLVQPKDAVALIDSAQLRAQHLRTEAEVASAKSLVAQAQAQIAQTEAQLRLAERELQRASVLVKRGHTSQESYDTRLSQRDVAKATLEATKATLVSRERNVDAAIAARKEVETQIEDCKLIAPTLGRVLYRLSEPGEVLPSGGKVMTLINLDEVYMEIFLPAADAHRLAIGSDARIVIDGADFAIPATVIFVSPQAQFTPKQVETESEREKLLFRIKVRVPTELVKRHIQFVKTGIRGVAYVRPGMNAPAWPEWLEKRFEPPEQPDDKSATES